MIEYGFVRQLDMDLESAVELVKEHLQSKGFAVLTTIDVKERLQEKLGIEFKKYIILGVCDTVNTYKALCVEENIGLILPGNVVVYESDGGATVAVIRPTVAMQMIDNLDLRRVAKDIERRLKSVIDTLQPVGATT
jgi:uncharacterized protein (DUF302 family)